MPSVVAGRFQDGSIMLRPFLMLSNMLVGAAGRDSVPVARALETGEILDTIGLFPAIDYVRLSNGMVTAPIWHRESAIVARRNSVLVGMGDEYIIEEYGLDGRLRRRISRSGVVPRKMAPLKEAYIAASAQFFGSSGPGSGRQVIEERFVGGTLPAYGRDWLIDADENLWVPDYVPEFPGVTPTGEVAWSVFDPAGRWLGQVMIPINFRPKEIGSDYLLGVWLDEFDVESVRRFELLR